MSVRYYPNAITLANDEDIDGVPGDRRGRPHTSFTSDQPDGTSVGQVSAVMAKFVDGFGGNALDTTKWDRVNVSGGASSVSVTVATSNLIVALGTAAMELHLISKQMFTLPFDLSVVCRITQRIANQFVDVDFIQVDPTTGATLTNDFAAGEPRSRSGLRFTGTTNTVVNLAVLGQQNPTEVLSGNATVAATTGNTDYKMAFRVEDIWLTTAPTDSTAIKANTAARISSQGLMPTAVYKLRLRFRNTATVTATTFNINRILVMDHQELPVRVMSGEGDVMPGLGLPVNVTNTISINSPSLANGSNTIGNVVPVQGTVAAGATALRAFSAASTNATVLKASAGKLFGGMVKNLSASTRFLKFYNKATAPTVGTDATVLVFPIAAGETLYVSEALGVQGYNFATGIGFAITGGVADADTTAIAANDVVLNLLYA